MIPPTKRGIIPDVSIFKVPYLNNFKKSIYTKVVL